MAVRGASRLWLEGSAAASPPWEAAGELGPESRRAGGRRKREPASPANLRSPQAVIEAMGQGRPEVTPLSSKADWERVKLQMILDKLSPRHKEIIQLRVAVVEAVLPRERCVPAAARDTLQRTEGGGALP